jgi:glutamyl-tRNA synthetase
MAGIVGAGKPQDHTGQDRSIWNGRFAPSPTGELHVGNLRTALVAWLVARSHGARFVIRMEDLDHAVSRREFASDQLRDLELLGLDWDGPVLYQSERNEHYHAALEGLVEQGRVYECFCSRREIQAASQAPNGPLLEGRYPGTCRELSAAARAAHVRAGRQPALRLKASSAEGVVTDLLCGDQSFPIDDLVLKRNDGTWAYNLAVVIDDAYQHVGTVVRADDLLSSTPRQQHLGELLGLRPQRYAHVPLVVNESGQRLAKRDGAVTLSELAASGIDPAQLLGLLGWSLGLRPEPSPIRSAADLVTDFALSDLPTTAWVFRTRTA